MCCKINPSSGDPGSRVPIQYALHHPWNLQPCTFLIVFFFFFGCHTPDSNDWLVRSHLKGNGWCDASSVPVEQTILNRAKTGFILPTRFGDITKLETAAVAPRPAREVWRKTGGQSKASFHWKNNGFSGRKKRIYTAVNQGLKVKYCWSYFTDVFEE